MPGTTGGGAKTCSRLSATLEGDESRTSHQDVIAGRPERVDEHKKTKSREQVRGRRKVISQQTNPLQRPFLCLFHDYKKHTQPKPQPDLHCAYCTAHQDKRKDGDQLPASRFFSHRGPPHGGDLVRLHPRVHGPSGREGRRLHDEGQGRGRGEADAGPRAEEGRRLCGL